MKKFFLIALAVGAKFALATGTCLLVYDPYGHENKAPIIYENMNVFYNPNCDAMIFYPPIPELHNIDEKTGIQKVTLTPEKRREIVEAFATRNVAADMKGPRIDPLELGAFLKKVKETSKAPENITQSIFDFHGNVRGLHLRKEETDANYDQKVEGLMSKETFDYSDLLILTQSRPQEVDRLKQKLERTPDGNWKNPCAILAQKAHDALMVAVNDMPIMQEDQKLSDAYEKSTDKKKQCSFFTKAEVLLKKHYLGPRSKDLCRIAKENFETNHQDDLCREKYFSINIIDAGLFGAQDGGMALIPACSVGLEDGSSTTDSLTLLRGCPKEFSEIQKALKAERKDASLASAKRLCQGVETPVNFAIAVDVTQTQPPYTKTILDITNSNTTPADTGVGPYDLPNATQIYNDLKAECDKTFSEDWKKFEDSASELRGSSEDDSEKTNLKESFYRQKLEELTCDPDAKLDESENEDLKIDLQSAHASLLMSAYDAGSTYLDLPPAYVSKAPYKKLVQLMDKTKKTVNELYERLDLSKKESQIKALERYVYLSGQNFKSTGFYDCYKCVGSGEAEKGSCEKMRESFSGGAYIGDRQELSAVKDFKLLAQKIESSAEQAESGTPPFCHKPVPPCDFKTCPKPASDVPAEHKQRKK